MKKILAHLLEYKSFSRKEAYDILTRIATGIADTHLVTVFMTIYGMLSVRVEELGVFRDAMFDLCQQIAFDVYDLIFMCVIGGDGNNTVKITTLASFVVAGA